MRWWWWCGLKRKRVSHTDGAREIPADYIVYTVLVEQMHPSLRTIRITIQCSTYRLKSMHAKLYYSIVLGTKLTDTQREETGGSCQVGKTGRRLGGWSVSLRQTAQCPETLGYRNPGFQKKRGVVVLAPVSVLRHYPCDL